MTDRQRRFLRVYLADPARNATRAAEAVGYRWPDKQGPRLKTFPEIAVEIRADEQLQREWAARKGLDPVASARFWRSLPEWYRKGLDPPVRKQRRPRRM